MRTVEQIIERWENVLRVLTSMTRHERNRHFEMIDWGRKTSCGTIACAAGHCSLDPWFRRRGFSGEFRERDGLFVDVKQLIPKTGQDWPEFIEDFFIGDTGGEPGFDENLYELAEDATGVFYCQKGVTFREVTTAIRVILRKLRKLQEEQK